MKSESIRSGIATRITLQLLRADRCTLQILTGFVPRQDDPDCKHLLVLHADSKGPEVDTKMVAGAWKFSAIHAAYQQLEVILERFSEIEKIGTREALAEWTADENTATSKVLRLDPFLPSILLPKRYRGKVVWKKRAKTLAKAAKLAASLRGGVGWMCMKIHASLRCISCRGRDMRCHVGGVLGTCGVGEWGLYRAGGIGWNDVR